MESERTGKSHYRNQVIMKKQGLQPVVGDNPRTLILGSLPGDESILRQEYYGNPKNLFWKVIGNILGLQVPTTYPEKISVLKSHGIALWDVLHSAERQGSLDINIKDEEFNDIAGLLARHPSISVIALNGGKAAASFSKYLKSNPSIRSTRIVYCTSTSSMSICAGWNLERLTEQWKAIL